jgi:hypothetical protein
VGPPIISSRLPPPFIFHHLSSTPYLTSTQCHPGPPYSHFNLLPSDTCPSPFHRSIISNASSLDQSCPVTSSFIVSPHPCLVTAHPPLPIMCPSLRTGLHALSIRSFSRSRWQRERASTSQECRVDRVIPNPKEAVIEVVGGG